jgi:hypothetical protein
MGRGRGTVGARGRRAAELTARCRPPPPRRRRRAAAAAASPPPPPGSPSVPLSSTPCSGRRRRPLSRAPHLAAEVAEVLGVLADLHLLDLLAQRRAVARAVLADDADLRMEGGGRRGRGLGASRAAQAAPSAPSRAAAAARRCGRPPPRFQSRRRCNAAALWQARPAAPPPVRRLRAARAPRAAAPSSCASPAGAGGQARGRGAVRAADAGPRRAPRCIRALGGRRPAAPRLQTAGGRPRGPRAPSEQNRGVVPLPPAPRRRRAGPWPPPPKRPCPRPRTPTMAAAFASAVHRAKGRSSARARGERAGSGRRGGFARPRTAARSPMVLPGAPRPRQPPNHAASGA